MCTAPICLSVEAGEGLNQENRPSDKFDLYKVVEDFSPKLSRIPVYWLPVILRARKNGLD